MKLSNVSNIVAIKQICCCETTSENRTQEPPALSTTGAFGKSFTLTVVDRMGQLKQPVVRIGQNAKYGKILK